MRAEGVVETVFLDWLLSLGVGLLFGRLGMRALEDGRSRLASPAFRAGALTQAVLMAVSVTLYALSPEWMWMYWADPAQLPLGIVVLAFAMYAVAFLAGFLLAPELERLRPGAAWWALGAVAAGATLLELLAWDRLTRLGTVSEFASGTAGALSGAFLAVLVVGGGALIVLGAMLARSLRAAVPEHV
jgi:multisubunit Na+/H+ antiporter MnhB subunit